MAAQNVTHDSHADAGAVERSETFVVDLDIVLRPAEDVCPGLSDVFFAYEHSDLTRTGIAHDDSTSIWLVPSTSSNPSNAVLLVEIVVLLAYQNTVSFTPILTGKVQTYRKSKVFLLVQYLRADHRKTVLLHARP